MAFRINHMIIYGIPALAAARLKMMARPDMAGKLSAFDTASAHFLGSHGIHPAAHIAFMARFPDFTERVVSQGYFNNESLCSKGLSYSVTWSSLGDDREGVLEYLHAFSTAILSGSSGDNQIAVLYRRVRRIPQRPYPTSGRVRLEDIIAPFPLGFRGVTPDQASAPVEFLRSIVDKWRSLAASKFEVGDDDWAPSPRKAKLDLPWAGDLPSFPLHDAYLNEDFLVTYTRRLDIAVDKLPPHKRPDPIGITAASPPEEYIWVPASDTKLETMKPGRYLTAFYPHLTPEQVTEWARKVDTANEVKFATDADDMVRVYTNGPSSCMSHGPSQFKGVHPVKAYAGGDLAVAYLAEPSGRITARALVWPEKKLYGRAYGDPPRLQRALEKLGYSPGSLKGAKLAGIPRGEGIALPYIDNELYVTVNRETGEMFLGNIASTLKEGAPVRGLRPVIVVSHGGTSGVNNELRVCRKSGLVGSAERDFASVFSKDTDEARATIHHFNHIPAGTWTCRGNKRLFIESVPKVTHEDRTYSERYFKDHFKTCSVLKRFFPRTQVIPRADDRSLYVSKEALAMPTCRFADANGLAAPKAIVERVRRRLEKTEAENLKKAAALRNKYNALAAQARALENAAYHARHGLVQEVTAAVRERAKARAAARIEASLDAAATNTLPTVDAPVAMAA